jgi:acetoin utilization protein AcuC
MQQFTIGGINKLPEREKREIYARYIPRELTERFNLHHLAENTDLLQFRFAEGSSDVEIMLYHEVNFPDPVLYAHLADSITGQIFILLYILNDPASPRFNVDKMPDGSPTQFGIRKRNIEAEQAALEGGLSPGQVRKGLRALGHAIQTFEEFMLSLGHEMYYIEPLYYHNAILFERYGFSYQMGRKQMNEIQAGFEQGGGLRQKLDDTNPFRSSRAASGIRLRSWAIHDGILGKPFTNVTMYKHVGKSANINSAQGCEW